jgi:hypothetical protein
MIYTEPLKLLLAENDQRQIQCVTTPAGRVYYSQTPEGITYAPSITTVMKAIPKPGIVAWKKRVGLREAERVSKAASLRGDQIHGAAEAYLRDGKSDRCLHLTHRPFWQALWPKLEPYRTRLVASEHALAHRGLGVVGRFDLLVSEDQGYRLLDIKTSSKPWHEMSPTMQAERSADYLMQLSVYWHALRRWGVPMTGADILMVSEGWCQVIPLVRPTPLLLAFKATLDGFLVSPAWTTCLDAAKLAIDNPTQLVIE